MIRKFLIFHAQSCISSLLLAEAEMMCYNWENLYFPISKNLNIPSNFATQIYLPHK